MAKKYAFEDSQGSMIPFWRKKYASYPRDLNRLTDVRKWNSERTHFSFPEIV